MTVGQLERRSREGSPAGGGGVVAGPVPVDAGPAADRIAARAFLPGGLRALLIQWVGGGLVPSSFLIPVGGRGSLQVGASQGRSRKMCIYSFISVIALIVW